jgi:hypothetical protein
MSLDWRPLYRRSESTVRYKLRQLWNTRMSVTHRRHIMDACIPTVATYPFAEAPFTDTQLYVPMWTYNPLLHGHVSCHIPHSSYGPYCPSLHVAYHSTCWRELVRALCVCVCVCDRERVARRERACADGKQRSR